MVSMVGTCLRVLSDVQALKQSGRVGIGKSETDNEENPRNFYLSMTISLNN